MLVQEPLILFSSNKKINCLKKKFKTDKSFKNFSNIFNYYNKITFKYIIPLLFTIKHPLNFNLIFADDDGNFYYSNKIVLSKNKFFTEYSNIVSNEFIEKKYKSYMSNQNKIYNPVEEVLIKNIVSDNKLYTSNLKTPTFIPFIGNNQTAFSIYTGSSTTYSYSSTGAELLINNNYFYPNNSSGTFNPSNNSDTSGSVPISYCALFPYNNYFSIAPTNNLGEYVYGVQANTSITKINVFAGGSGGCSSYSSLDSTTINAGASGGSFNVNINGSINYDSISYYLSYVEFIYNYSTNNNTWYDTSGNIINFNSPGSTTGTCVSIEYIGNNTNIGNNINFCVNFLAQDAYYNTPGIVALSVDNFNILSLGISTILNNISSFSSYPGQSPLSTTTNNTLNVPPSTFKYLCAGNTSSGTNEITYQDNTNFFSNGGTSIYYSFNSSNSSTIKTQPSTNGFGAGGGTYNLSPSPLVSTSYPYSQNGLDTGTCGFAYVAFS